MKQLKCAAKRHIILLGETHIVDLDFSYVKLFNKKSSLAQHFDSS